MVPNILRRDAAMKFQWKKNLLAYTAIAVVCVMIGSAVTLTHQPTAQAENTAQVVTSPFTAAIAQVKDSVVGISNYQNVRYTNRGNSWADYFGFGFGYPGYNDDNEYQTQEVEAATGSGVVIGQGYVLTNYHVVEDANSLKVTVSKPDADEPDAFDAALVAYDENLDVAILYAPDLKLSPVTLGDSDTLQVGDWAICIGNPLGAKFSGTVTTGIVSALNRNVSSTSYDKYGRKETITNTMIQTDAAINSGNSGGGMFNTQGELMGIPTLKYTGSAYSGATVEGIGMCIPINAAKPLIEDVLSGKLTDDVNPTKSGTVTSSTNNDMIGKPRIGITMSTFNGQNIFPNGVVVLEVEKNSPAAAGGIQPGDIIVDVNGTVITGATQIQDLIKGMAEGDKIAMKVYRAEGMLDLINGDAKTSDIPDGEYIDLEVTLAVIDAVKQ